MPGTAQAGADISAETHADLSEGAKWEIPTLKCRNIFRYLPVIWVVLDSIRKGCRGQARHPFHEQIVKVIWHVEMRAELLTPGFGVEPPVRDGAGRADRIVHPQRRIPALPKREARCCVVSEMCSKLSRSTMSRVIDSMWICPTLLS